MGGDVRNASYLYVKFTSYSAFSLPIPNYRIVVLLIALFACIQYYDQDQTTSGASETLEKSHERLIEHATRNQQLLTQPQEQETRDRQLNTKLQQQLHEQEIRNQQLIARLIRETPPPRLGFPVEETRFRIWSDYSMFLYSMFFPWSSISDSEEIPSYSEEIPLLVPATPRP